MYIKTILRKTNSAGGLITRLLSQQIFSYTRPTYIIATANFFLLKQLENWVEIKGFVDEKTNL